MNFNLTEQQQQIVDQVREFTAQRLAPGVLERDEQQVFPVEAFKEFGAMGMFGLCYPKEFGGTDVGYLPYILAVEEVSKVDSSFGIGFSVNRYGRTEKTLPLSYRQRQGHRLLRSHRSISRLRRSRTEDHCHEGRRRLHSQRHEDFQYQRPPG